MTIKEQLRKIKENWILAAIILVLVLFLFFGSSLGRIGVSEYSYESPVYKSASMELAENSLSYLPSPIAEDFAPEISIRKITKTASLSTEVERGTFSDAEKVLKDIVTSSGSFLLNENVYKYDKDRNSYYLGNYEIKVEVQKYDSVASQLKNMGEIISFSENARDVTGTYKDVNIELETERARLARYREILEEATTVEEKMELNDRIFNQERTIKYLEDSLKNIDQSVAYSTISVQLKEKESGYANVVFVKFSQLVRRFVSSLNSLISLVVTLLPYGITALIIWLLVKKFKKKKK